MISRISHNNCKLGLTNPLHSLSPLSFAHPRAISFRRTTGATRGKFSGVFRGFDGGLFHSFFLFFIYENENV